MIGVIFEFNGVFKFFNFPFIIITDCSSGDMPSESISKIFSKFLSPPDFRRIFQRGGQGSFFMGFMTKFTLVSEHVEYSDTMA